MSSEEWRAIPGYEGRYDVNDLGRCESAYRAARRQRVRLARRAS